MPERISIPPSRSRPLYATGVVIGKFYPPHRGHTYLIDVARAHTERLTVIVCDRAGQSIAGTLRAAWLQELHPDVTVMRIDDVYPDDDSALWAELTIRWLGHVPDAVFTSEDYGDAYARLMGSAHVLVDRARVHIPCSGTAIRRDPLAWWDYLDPPVRAYFCRRICVVGAESSGTTTLAQALAAHYETVWVPEYGRAYSEAKVRWPGPEASAWQTQEFVHIAREQGRQEDEAARRANRLLIADTDMFATEIWHERYVGTTSPVVAALAAARPHPPDLVHRHRRRHPVRPGRHARRRGHPPLDAHPLPARATGARRPAPRRLRSTRGAHARRDRGHRRRPARG